MGKTKNVNKKDNILFGNNTKLLTKQNLDAINDVFF